MLIGTKRVMRYVLENWNIKGVWRLTVPDWWHSSEVVCLFELHIFSWFLHDFNSQCWTMSNCLECDVDKDSAIGELAVNNPQLHVTLYQTNFPIREPQTLTISPLCKTIQKTKKNTFEKSYDYIITLIRKRKTHYLLFNDWMALICKTLSLLHPRMLCVKFD